MKKFCIFIITIALVCISAVCAGCAAKESNAPEMITLDTWIFTSGVPNNLITVHAENEDTVFTLLTDNGDFYYADETGYYRKQVTLKSGEFGSWQGVNDMPQQAHIKIVAKNNDDIVGYAAIKVEKDDSWYNATVLKSVWFDSSEEVTPEQVDSLIEQAIKG